MILATALALAMARQDDTILTRVLTINNNPNIRVAQRINKLDAPKLSPKVFNENRWEFDWITWGYGAVAGLPQGNLALRLRVYSQEQRSQKEKSPLIARMMMQIWDKLYRQYNIDHQRQYREGLVDVYLCFGGEPGGEQEFSQELDPGKAQPEKVNTIYIYQLSTFTDPVEMAREVAHEYGHATLPAIGGFKKPEDWGNGYLGERVFMRWMRDGMASGKLEPADAMGATKDQLDGWLKKNVDPLVLRAATNSPDATAVIDTPMDAFTGLACYVDMLCPPAVFANSLRLTAFSPAKEYASNVLLAMENLERVTLSVPEMLRSRKSIWIPLGKGKLTGGNILKRKNGWAEVAPLTSVMSVTFSPGSGRKVTLN